MAKRWLLHAATAVFQAGLIVACGAPPAALTRLVEARALASDLHVQFAQAAEAANRAVMADADDPAAAAVNEARRAREHVNRDIASLRVLLDALGFVDDRRSLEGFVSRFDEYRRLDEQVLPLALENTNVKAQRLSFGSSREAARGFRTALDRATQIGRGNAAADAAAARAWSALLQIQVLYGPHIAESDDAAMTNLEAEMSASLQAAAAALDRLQAMLPPSSEPPLADARTALARFRAIHEEIIQLSRRNSDVRSLALSLGRKRVVTAECEAQLQALEEELARHELVATR